MKGAQDSRPAPGSWLDDASISTKLLMIVIALGGVTIALLAVAIAAYDVSSGVRAYVGGEGLYSKGQKDAVYHLTRYAASREEADYLAYQQAITVPLGDHQARLALQSSPPDKAAATAGFLAGGNAAEDIPQMILLFRRFQRISFFARAIELWTQADALVEQIETCGGEMHALILAGQLDDEGEGRLLDRIEQINDAITPIEHDFSNTLGQGARWVGDTVRKLIVGATLVLLTAGLWVAWRIARGLRANIADLQSATVKVNRGDLSARSRVRSRDELGHLALAFNDMVARRQHVEEQLQEATQFRDKVMESVTNSIYALDLEGRFQLVNRRTCEITGYPLEELIGEPFAKLIPAENRGQVQSVFQEISHGGNAVVSYETPLLRKDGSRRLITFRSSPVYKGREIAGVVGSAEDVTARRQYEASLHEARELAQITLSSIGDGVIRTDQRGVITFCNPAAAKLLETDTDYPVGKPFASIVHLFDDDGGGPLEDPITRVLQTGTTLRLNMFSSVRTMLGKRQPIADSVAPLRDAQGAIVGAVFVFQDVSDVRLMTEKLAHQAHHDQLTGLPNRPAFKEALKQAISTSLRGEQTHFLLFMDLDHFKVVNDTCGHAAGDQLLKDISALLTSRLRPADFLARLGGDEFAVLLHGASRAAARRVAENLLEAVRDYQLTCDGRTFRVGLSIGISEINSAAGDASRVMAQADTACYAAKSSGRGRCQMYQPDLLEIQQVTESLNWAQRIESALSENRFEVHLQQIVNRQRQPVGFESLIRMRDEHGQIVVPDAFIPSAKRMGWLARIDQWMVREVIQLARQRNAAGRTAYLSVNLSAKSIGDPEFVDWMLSTVDGCGLGREALRFEVTETEQLQASPVEFRLINELRQRGFRVWLDDFGMGYNSFDLLKRLTVDGLKIDISFTRDLMSDPVDRVMVEAIISIGKAMNLELLAEGVENENTFKELAAMGVQLFQGHLFHQAQVAANVNG